MSQSLAGGRALGASAREATRVAALAPKHAAGRARRAMRVQALAAGAMMPVRAASSYMGQKLVARPAAPSMYVAKKSYAKGKQRLVITNMFERFTEKAIKVVMLAQEEARRLGHNFVGTEQILLGLIGESTGIAAKVLKSMGVNLKDARVEVEKIIGRGSGFVAVEIPFTPRAKRVLELSLEEARQLGASPISRASGARRAAAAAAAPLLGCAGAPATAAAGGCTRPAPRGCSRWQPVAASQICVASPAAAAARRGGGAPRSGGIAPSSRRRARGRCQRRGRSAGGAGPASPPCLLHGPHAAPPRRAPRAARGPGAQPAAPAPAPAGHNYIGTEHILLGLLREGEGVAARVLETLGADPSKIRTQVIRMVGESQEAVGAGVGGTTQGTNKMPTLEEYGTNLTTQAEEVRGRLAASPACLARMPGCCCCRRRRRWPPARHCARTRAPGSQPPRRPALPARRASWTPWWAARRRSSVWCRSWAAAPRTTPA
jgi:hypothetical protein